MPSERDKQKFWMEFGGQIQVKILWLRMDLVPILNGAHNPILCHSFAIFSARVEHVYNMWLE